MSNFKVLLILLLFIPAFSNAQDSMTLHDLVKYAWAHNINLRQESFSLEQQKLDVIKSTAGALPSINASANQNYNFGRTIDPATNQFVNQQSHTNYFSLQGDIVIFNGLQRLNLIRQSRESFKAQESSIEKSKEETALSIANYYLQILQLSEREKQINVQVENSGSNYNKAKILYEAGAITYSKCLESKAQLASDEAALIDVQNQLEKTYMDLKLILNFDITKPLYVKKIAIQKMENKYSESDLQKALSNRVDSMPAVQQAVNLKNAAQFGFFAAKGNYYPRLTASGSLHSVFSSAYQNVLYQPDGYQIIGILNLDTGQKVYGPKIKSFTSFVPFDEQLRNNFGQSIGFSLVIPVFNGYQSRYNVQYAKINLKYYEANLEDSRNKTKNDIYQSFSNMKLAEKKLNATQLKMDAQQEIFNQANAAYLQGTISYFDFNTQKAQFNSTQIELLEAKYEYIFQTKIFEYYLGISVE
jgi:outer membrane protein